MTPPAISKAGRVMPNMRKISLPARAKVMQDDEAGERSAARHALLAFSVGTVGDGEEGGDGGEGIDEKEDGTDGQHGEAHVVRMQGVDRYAGWSVHALNLNQSGHLAQL